MIDTTLQDERDMQISFKFESSKFKSTRNVFDMSIVSSCISLFSF